MKFTITHSNVTRIFYYALTNTQILIVNDIKYTTVNYVDDSTNTIPYKTSPELQTYLNHFYKLLISFYNINYLKINPDN